MKALTKYRLIGTFLSVSLFFMLTSAGAQSDENQKLKAMIFELETKIEDADKRMVAHPKFLEELSRLVEKYKSQLRELFFKDTFADGNFNKTPEWIVKSGHFSVNDAGRLSNLVAMQPVGTESEKKPEEMPEKNKSIEAEAVGILLDSIFGPAPKKESQQEEQIPEQMPEPVQPASIYTQRTFPPAFEMNFKFKSSGEGEMVVTLLGSQSLLPRYRLKIKANHSEADPMEIIRESRSRSFVVGAGTKFPEINDGNLHTLSWIRFTNGAMNVLIDGDVILQTYEVYYRDNFTGFELTNNGGSYEWDSFEIFKARKPQAD